MPTRPCRMCPLAAAWRHVALRGRRRLLVPLLVTGLKIWHLREGGSFYPRAQFWNTAGRLPTGSEIVVVAGEIDCREGLAQAVEKLKAGGPPRFSSQHIYIVFISYI